MTDSGKDSDASYLLSHAVWAQLNMTIQAVTGWRTVLLDRAGIVYRDSDQAAEGEARGLAPAVARAAVAAGQQRRPVVLFDPAPEGPPRRWAVVPIVVGAGTIGLLLMGGLPATEAVNGGPSIGLDDAWQATEMIRRLIESIADLYNAAAPPSVDGGMNRNQAARQRTALYDLSTLITSALEIDPIVELLLTQTRQLFDADRAAVFLATRHGGIRCVNAVGLSPAYVAAVSGLYNQQPAGGLLGTRHPVYIPDAPTDPALAALQDQIRQEGFCSLVVVPFVHQGQSIGLLSLYHDTPRAYSAEDLAVLSTFANHVAVALVNARLFEDAARQVRRSTFLAEAGRLLNSSLEMNQVLNSLVQAVTDVLAEACGIYLLRNNEDELDLTAYADHIDAAVATRRSFLEERPPRLGVPGIGLAALRGEAMLFDALAGPLPEGVDLYAQEFGAHAYLAVPLLAQNRLVGALVIWLFNPALRFTADDVALAQALADRAAVALENARLYERELRAQQAKDEFLSSVSHELRTPLTAIMGYTQLMRKNAPSENTRLNQQVNIIWSQAQRLHRLVETILDVTNIEQGQLTLNLERLGLWALVGTAFERLRSTTRPGLTFTTRQDTPECWIMGDRQRLEQVFGHLLANAIKYSPPNGTIEIDLSNQVGRAVVRVSDRGPGMSIDQLAHLFQRYYQGNTPLNRAGGLGLGLYISRAIIEAHGGTIRAESSPGAGATFYITLPAE